jgi:hypothetical protein
MTLWTTFEVLLKKSWDGKTLPHRSVISFSGMFARGVDISRCFVRAWGAVFIEVGMMTFMLYLTCR